MKKFLILLVFQKHSTQKEQYIKEYWKHLKNLVFLPSRSVSASISCRILLKPVQTLSLTRLNTTNSCSLDTRTKKET